MFAEHLGWSRAPAADRKWQPFEVKGTSYERRAVAEMGGVMVFEVRGPDGQIPDADRRLQVFRDVVKLHHEHLLIFVDKQETQSLWYWVKRDGKQTSPRSHLYMTGQPGDLLIGELDAMHFDIAELDEVGNAPVVEVARRLRAALDVEKVTKRFYADFQTLHESFIGKLKHVRGENDRRWYASVLLNRLMFVYFLQKRGFVLGNQTYLQQKLAP